MKNKRATYLLNPIFLIGLLVLIGNDHYAKAAYGNWFTGKLSDFVGVLILPFFLQFLFQRDHRISLLATVVCFTYWKSPLAQGLIDGVNALVPLNLGRVVDYTDLWAFAMLPLADYGLRRIERFALPIPAADGWAYRAVLPLAMLAFIATSRAEDFPPEASPLVACCSIDPVNEMVGSGRVYIPNAFTPDGDGINDLFLVQADTGIARIDFLEIIDLADNAMVFSQEDLAPTDPDLGWNGVARSAIMPGVYRYVISVTATNGVTSVFDGEVCNLPCRTPSGLPLPADIDNCAFPVQFDPAQGFDPTLPSGESLNCF